MGYNTDFSGAVTVTPRLNEGEIAFLRKFGDSDYQAEDIPKSYCQWVPSDDGTEIGWDDGEKFYESAEWMQFLIDHFLRPDGTAKGLPGFEDLTFDHVCEGVIFAQGEETDDLWAIKVTGNDVHVIDAIITYPGLTDES